MTQIVKSSRVNVKVKGNKMNNLVNIWASMELLFSLSPSVTHAVNGAVILQIDPYVWGCFWKSLLAIILFVLALINRPHWLRATKLFSIFFCREFSVCFCSGLNLEKKKQKKSQKLFCSVSVCALVANWTCFFLVPKKTCS